MQHLALGAATITPGDTGNRLAVREGMKRLSAATEAACVFRARYYYDFAAHDGGFRMACSEPWEEYPAGDDNEMRWTRWKRSLVWAGAAVASWALVIGCAAIVRTLLH
jgi:hypothetical protein